MRKHNRNIVKFNEQDTPTFFGTGEAGNAEIRCGDCGGRVVADGGVNFYRDLTAFQQQILVVLRRIERGKTGEGTAYGLAIKRELEALRGEEVNHGRLYPNLDQLVEQDLVEKAILDRRTNEYSTTEVTRKLIDEHARWVTDSVGERLAVTDGGEDA
jgi:DNA-binding MarR family transcriptional regulator